MACLCISKIKTVCCYTAFLTTMKTKERTIWIHPQIWITSVFLHCIPTLACLTLAYKVIFTASAHCSHLTETEISSKANAVDLVTELTSIRKISNFVNNMDKHAMEVKRKQDYAKSWDNLSFIVYLVLDIIYMFCSVVFFKTQKCSSNKLNF